VPTGLMVLALLLSGLSAALSQTPGYTVGGVILGSRVRVDSSEYREYSCGPSAQFDGFTQCRKTREEREKRGSFTAIYSLLHSPDGTVVYVNRYQEPAFFDSDEENEDIQWYSRRLGEFPRIERMPHRPGFRDGVLATWGKVILEPLDNDSIKILADGRSPKKGYIIDFIGDIVRSAKDGLPIYRLSGGAGFVWAASFDRRDRGTLRFAAIDASAFYPELTATPVSNGTQSSDAQVAALETQLAEVQRAKAAADTARQSAERAAEKANVEAQAAKREARLVITEIQRLKSDATTLNDALEGLRSQAAVLEAKTRAIQSIAYVMLVALIAIIAVGAYVSLMRRNRSTAAKHETTDETTAPETKLVLDLEHSSPSNLAAANGSDRKHSKPSTAASALSSAEVPQSPSNATIDQNNSGASEAKSTPSEARASDMSEASKQELCRPIRIYRIDPRLLAQGR
jgi:hypothetical protein